jgi:hypothetical protein
MGGALLTVFLPVPADETSVSEDSRAAQDLQSRS